MSSTHGQRLDTWVERRRRCQDSAALSGRSSSGRAFCGSEIFSGRGAHPLAVRSSSLLEDSQYQPFTAVYETFILTNQHADDSLRLAHLIDAIKLVYASTFSRHAKAYVRATPFRLEEDKMAVILQQVVGAFHGPRSIRIFPASRGQAISIPSRR